MIQWQDAGAVKVDNMTAVIYGPPGVGKTTLAFTADRPALLDFDAGAHRAGNRSGKKVLSKPSFQSVESITPADVEGIGTLVIDTLGPLVDSIMREALGNSRQPTIQHWGKVRQRFLSWVRRLKTLPADVLFLAHTDERVQGELVVERLQASGSSKQVVYQIADLMGRMMVDERGKRWLDFNPHGQAFAKDAGIGRMPVDDPTTNPRAMAAVIERAKASMNAQSETTSEETERLSQVAEELAIMRDDELTAAVLGAAETGMTDAEKILIRKEAAKRGLAWDKAQNKFVGG